jgi:hypothetical protein
MARAKNQYAFVSRDVAESLARAVIQLEHGIKNPPQWLICAYAGLSYRL